MRKKTKRKKRSKVLIFSLLLVLSAIFFWYFKDAINYAFNMVSLEYVSLIGSTCFPRYVMDEPIKLEDFSGNLLLISENSVSIYSARNAAKFLDVKHSASSGGVTHNGKQLAVYDGVNGNINVYNKFVRLHSEQNKGTVYSVEMAPDGKMAVIEDSGHHVSNVHIKNKSGNHQIEWHFNQTYALMAAFSNDSRELLLLSLSSVAGEPCTSVGLFDIASGKLKKKFDTEDVVYHVEYTTGGRVVVVTDSNVYFLNSALKLINTFKFNGADLRVFDCNAGLVALCFEDYGINNSFKVIAFGSDGNQLGSTKINEEELKSIKCSKNNIGILTEKNILLFNKHLERVKSYNCNVPIYDFICIGKYLFLVSANELSRVEF
jgi:hypothetical protein